MTDDAFEVGVRTFGRRCPLREPPPTARHDRTEAEDHRRLQRGRDIGAAPQARRHDGDEEDAADPEHEADEQAGDRVLGDRLLRRDRGHVRGVDDATRLGDRLRTNLVTLNRGVDLLYLSRALLAVVEHIGIRRSLRCAVRRGRVDRGVVRGDLAAKLVLLGLERGNRRVELFLGELGAVREERVRRPRRLGAAPLLHPGPSR